MTVPIRVNTEAMNEGEGARIERLMPIPGLKNHDPIVLFDHFHIGGDAGFPDHPHRGFEAITYIFEGGSEHRDNLGNHSTVLAGGAQRFTAGAGIIHSEMPAVEGDNSGIQLWINLPQRLKGVAPDYQQVEPEAIPQHAIPGGIVRVIVGEGSPLQLLTPVCYLDLTLEAGASFKQAFPEAFNGLIYLLAGTIESGGVAVSPGKALLFEQVDAVTLTAQTACHLMLAFGHPHGEPIKQWGPFVD